MKSTSDLYATALDVRVCAEAWEPDALLIGNVSAGDIRAMVEDYLRLRLKEGVSNDAPENKP